MSDMERSLLSKTRKIESEEQRKNNDLGPADKARLKAGKILEDQAAFAYYACLDNRARALSQNSNDPPKKLRKHRSRHARVRNKGCSIPIVVPLILSVP
jgi:hypothetical protein